MHIFNKIKGELEPVKLEVRGFCLEGDLEVFVRGVGGWWMRVIYHKVCCIQQCGILLRFGPDEIKRESMKPTRQWNWQQWLCPRNTPRRANRMLTQSQVQDISGGCGSMYAIEIESPKFKGLSVIKQHKLVNQVLKEEIAQWHGVQLRTRAA